MSGQQCRCGHGIGMHDIRRDKSRGACSVISGTRGVRCGCKSYEPVEASNAKQQ